MEVKRERENEPQAESKPRVEPHVGFRLTTLISPEPKLRVRHLTGWATQAPYPSYIFKMWWDKCLKRGNSRFLSFYSSLSSTRHYESHWLLITVLWTRNIIFIAIFYKWENRGSERRQTSAEVHYIFKMTPKPLFCPMEHRSIINRRPAFIYWDPILPLS